MPSALWLYHHVVTDYMHGILYWGQLSPPGFFHPAVAAELARAMRVQR